MHYIGIDPGKKGALGILDDGGHAVDVIPIPMQEGAHHPHGIAEQLNLWYKFFGALHVTVEKVRQLPKDRKSTPEEIRRELQKGRRPTGRTQLGGSKANFERGCAVCGWLWLLETFSYFRPNVTFESVEPKVWQAELLGKPADPKAASIAMAKQLFPGTRLIPPRGRVENNNFADALLIARYGERMQKAKLL